MKGLWWKLGSVALLMYVVVVGLHTPLRPALVHASEDRIAPGEVTIEVTGYNTHFKDKVWAWTDNGGIKTCLTVEVLSPEKLMLRGTIPAGLTQQLTDLRVASGQDGELVLHEAFFTEGLGTGAIDAPCTGIDISPTTSASGFPNRSILNETIRNLFFHVPMWFAMMTLMAVAFWRSLRVLRTGDLGQDRAALSAIQVSLLCAALGLITGSVWARVTWGGWWTNDPKLNGSAVTVLIYAAYLVLRGSIPDAHKRARLAAVYNIFAFVLMLVFVMVIPRLNDSLHPGNGGNPAFSQYDLDDSLRTVFYPAVLGWIGLSLWLAQLTDRTARLENLRHENAAR